MDFEHQCRARDGNEGVICRRKEGDVFLSEQDGALAFLSVAPHSLSLSTPPSLSPCLLWVDFTFSLPGDDPPSPKHTQCLMSHPSASLIQIHSLLSVVNLPHDGIGYPSTLPSSAIIPSPPLRLTPVCLSCSFEAH
ncbi:hypothetical protein ANANG_G00294430 [Anguilla anguilla]|uniref:Uncharacterized protein n=1 Tax=Anguilla anguilla TaxID=7936 RepID=A0A9D3LM34_ANGAN|nr:hypothetical protein ANANG_G00294430 [Anguilla anguilla]